MIFAGCAAFDVAGGTKLTKLGAGFAAACAVVAAGGAHSAHVAAGAAVVGVELQDLIYPAHGA